MKHHSATRSIRIVLLIATGLLPVAAPAADNPSATPTPRPRRLGDIKLKPDSAHDEAEGVVISDANLSQLAAGGTLTIGGTTTVAPIGAKRRSTSSRSDRARWREAVLDQKRVIVSLERKRLRIESEIDLIEDGRLTAHALARIQRFEIELQTVDRDIRAEKTELGRLIREARRHGAEPGWFR